MYKLSAAQAPLGSPWAPQAGGTNFGGPEADYNVPSVADPSIHHLESRLTPKDTTASWGLKDGVGFAGTNFALMPAYQDSHGHCHLVALAFVPACQWSTGTQLLQHLSGAMHSGAPAEAELDNRRLSGLWLQNCLLVG
jgi:hypothetical protein